MPYRGDMLVAWRVCITRKKIPLSKYMAPSRKAEPRQFWFTEIPRPSEAFQLTLRLPEGWILHSMLGDLPQNSEDPWIFPSRIGILSSLSRYTVCLKKNLCTHFLNSNVRMQSPRSNMTQQMGRLQMVSIVLASTRGQSKNGMLQFGMMFRASLVLHSTHRKGASIRCIHTPFLYIYVSSHIGIYIYMTYMQK